MIIEIFARQSQGVCTCILNLEYLLAYSCDCGFALSVHDWRESITCESHV